MKQSVTNDTKTLRTVYLVDDDPAVLRLLKAIVASIGVEAHAFASANEFLSAYRPTPCECLVCDMRMPQVDGIAVQQRLKAMQATLPIIFLTGFAEVGMAVDAMKHGAFDFVEKPFSAQSLLSKIESALESSRLRHAKFQMARAIEARKALLTQRENSVIRLVIEGQSSREIATELGISIRTVENHRIRAMEKLHVNSAVDLVKLFL